MSLAKKKVDPILFNTFNRKGVESAVMGLPNSEHIIWLWPLPEQKPEKQAIDQIIRSSNVVMLFLNAWDKHYRNIVDLSSSNYIPLFVFDDFRTDDSNLIRAGECFVEYDKIFIFGWTNNEYPDVDKQARHFFESVMKCYIK